jgi:hypothetical protein
MTEHQNEQLSQKGPARKGFLTSWPGRKSSQPAKRISAGETNAAYWRRIDRRNGEPISPSEARSEWFWSEKVVGRGL